MGDEIIGKDACITVIEDDDGLRELVIKSLKKGGYAAAGFAKGSEAVNYIKKNLPSALLIDQVLPDMTGEDIIQALADAGCKIPFILMTGQGDERLAVDMMKLGASDYLIKDTNFLDILPVAMERLFKTIKNERYLKAAEKKLIESENKYRLIAENTADVIIVSDMNFKRTYVSPSIERQLGYTVAESMNMKAYDLLTPESLEKVLTTFSKLVEIEQKGEEKDDYVTLEVQVKCKDGTLKWVEDTYSIPRDESGESLFIVCVRRDINERKKAEEKLLNYLKFEQRVSDISSGLLKNEEIDGSINDALELMGSYFGADRSYIFAISENHKRMDNIYEWCSPGIEPQMETLQDLPLHIFPVWMEKLGRGELIKYPDVGRMEDEAYKERETLQAQSIQSVFVLPMIDKENLAGFIGIDFVRQKIDFAEEQINQLKLVGELISTAYFKKNTEFKLEEAYLQLENEIDKAETIHRRVLPSELPQTEKFAIAAYNQPATRMGGDSYNVIRSDNKLIIYVADVMGHGFDGAMLSVFIKESIDSYIVLKPGNISPMSILKHLSKQYIRQNFPDKQLIAVFLAVLDLDTDEFIYSCAGFQTPPVLSREGGEKKMLETHGLFISNCIPPEMLTFDERSLIMQPGDTILISSDGLAEHENQGKMYEEQYVNIFYENSHLHPELIVQAINKDFSYFNDNSMVGLDDITYLILQYTKAPLKRHRLEIKSDFYELEDLYKKINYLTSDFTDNDNFAFFLHEIIVNAIEHGNKFDVSKRVTVDVIVSSEYVLFQVEDEGDGFYWHEKLDKPVNIETYSERGRGIALTGLISGKLYYNSKGNIATLLVMNK